MMLGPDSYVPSLHWRQAEYQALLRLRDDAKDRVVPFIIVPKPEFDFEKNEMRKTVQEQVQPFPRQFKLKWGMRPAWIDFHKEIDATRMQDGKLPIGHVFDALHEIGSAVVPVVSLGTSKEVVAVASGIVKRDGRGLGLRVRLEHMMRPGCAASVGEILTAAGITPSSADLIVDLSAPNYEPYDEFADALLAHLQKVGDVSAFRSFVLIGTAYPSSLGIDKPGGELTRHDWNFYQALRSKLPAAARFPNYGDYTIVPPSFSADLDFRKVRPAGKLIYTFGPKWMVRKGGAFNANRAQMHDHCGVIVNSGAFRGAAFSDGDDFIEKCARRAVKPTSQTRWKEIGISHHIMHVLEDLATLAAPA
jgi:T4 beta protein